MIGIAGAGDDHLALLSRIAEIFVDADRVAELRAARTPDDVLAVLHGGPRLAGRPGSEPGAAHR